MDNQQETPEDADPRQANANQEDEAQSFAELFESYTAGMNEDISTGDKVRGKIISISSSAVFVDTGTKADGVVERDELLDKDGQLPYSVGDELDLYVVKADESEIRLSRALSGIGGLNVLKEAYANTMPVEGKVQKSIKGGFEVEVLKRRAFCPISQIDIHYVENPAEYLGQTYHFLIKKFSDGGRNIVLSRQELLKQEQEKARQAFLQELSEDHTYTGRVMRVMPYGAFVELTPGVEGMVHISELSWSRLEKIEDAVKPGDTLEVKILSIETNDKEQKIALSAKQVQGDPWASAERKVQPGEKVQGKVTRCAKFGAFVEILPGIEGLVHISEMSYARRVLNPEDIVQPGDIVSVMIKEIDLEKRRVSLSMRDAEGDPWLEVHEKFSVGQMVEGTVEKQEPFGIFVTLSPGVTGLLPKSVMARSVDTGRVDKLKPGDCIMVMIDQINMAERKISLGLQDTKDESDWRQFASQSATRTKGLGSLGEQLAKALNSKKE